MTNNLEHSSTVLHAITSDELITTVGYTSQNIDAIRTRDIHFNTVNRKSGKISSRCATFTVCSLLLFGAAVILKYA